MARITATVLAAKKAANGMYPIFVRIAAKKEKAYIKTIYEIADLCQWYNGKVVARADASLMNKRLSFEVKKYEERVKDVDNYDTYTATQLKMVITQVDKATRGATTFTDFFRKRITELKKDGRDAHAKMNAETLRVFILSEGEVPFVIMNHITVEHFDAYMKRKGYSNGNRQIRLSHVKARINEAMKCGALKCNIHPFVYTKIPTAEPRECDLTIEEFQKVRNMKIDSKRMNLGKDMLLLSFYLCGINLKDLLAVNLSGDILSFERTKTVSSKTGKSNITIPIHKDARCIIDKYIGKNGMLNLGYSYTYSNLQRYINLCLSELKEHLEIKQRICFYSARKTFAQFASELGIPDGVIDYCLGHSDKSKGVIRFYTKVKQKQAEIAVNRVIDYVNDTEKYKDYIEMRADIMMMKG